jgi:hypothetical protein
VANDFSSESNCVSVWRLEDDGSDKASGVDSKGSNTLINYQNTASDLSNFKEGAASAVFNGHVSQGLLREDSSLSSDFPFKYGTSNDQMSLTAWFRLDNLDNWKAIAAKANTGNASLISWGLMWQVLDGRYYLTFYIYYTSDWVSDLLRVEFPNTPVAGQWYHVGLTYDRATKAAYLKIYDATNDSSNEGNATFTHTMQLSSSAGFSVGNTTNFVYRWNGNIDEVVVYKEIITEAKIDLIRQGLLNAPSGNPWYAYAQQ